MINGLPDTNPDDLQRLWQRRNFWLVTAGGLVMILGGYLPPFVIMGGFLLSDLQDLKGPVPHGLLIGGAFLLVYLAGVIPLLFYGPFDTYRYTPEADGLRIRTWRGIRHLRWEQVEAATVTPYRGAYTLRLRAGSFLRARIHLSDYRQPRSLFDAIESRLPVSVRGAEHFRAAVYDP
jgi:hypothetical protein